MTDPSILAHDADWQYPAITEQHACRRARESLPEVEGVVYLGFPWATLFDLLNRSHPRSNGLTLRLEELSTKIRETRPRIVATVCQHVDLQKYASLVSRVGVTDVFWSHCPKNQRALASHDNHDKICLHPFPLYPVHLADSIENRRPLLFSFAGAIENPRYLTLARTWIWDHLRGHPRGRVIARGLWHYHTEVYERQIGGADVNVATNDPKKEKEFRDLLGKSLFALCPSGSGPNTIRLWEAIGSGAIPVIISDDYLPPGPMEIWNEAAVFCREVEREIQELPAKLERMAEDTSLLRKKREAMKNLWEKYGPKNFVHDLEEFFKKKNRDTFPVFPVIQAASRAYMRKHFSSALKYYKKLDNIELKPELRRSVDFFKTICSTCLGDAKGCIRVLFVIPSGRNGATGRYTQVLAEGLLRLGASVMVLAEGNMESFENGVRWVPLSFEGPFLSSSLRRNILIFNPTIVYENGVRSRAQRAALEAVYLTGARFAMQSEDEDVQIHCFRRGEGARESLTLLDKNPVNFSEIGEFLGRMDWVRTLKVLQNPQYDRWVEPLLRAACYHLAEFHTAVWHPFAKRVEKLYGKPCLVVPPVCEDLYFDIPPVSGSQRGDILNRFQIPENTTVFFLAGAVYSYSQEFSKFVSALGMAAENSTVRFCLVIAGSGWKEAAKIAKAGLPSSVLFLNMEEPSDMQYLEMLKAADIICSPGLCDDFTRYRMPSRLVKAMAMGKAVLTSNCGFGESLEDGKNAFLTQGDNPHDWVRTILDAADSLKQAAVGQHGRDFAEANFRAGPVCKELMWRMGTLLGGMSQN